MTRVETRTCLALLATVLTSCASPGGSPASIGTSAEALSAPSVRFSEIHYDNASTDVGEAIEVSGPAGTDLTGWQVILYNGTGGASYTTSPLGGTIPATCDDRGVVVINYPSNGIQNGSPDGMALVDNTGAVVEFLSYEGVFAATNGPANGLTSTDIGVAEAGTEPAGQSLQRKPDGTWDTDKPSTFGACNDNGGTTPPPPVVASVTVSPPSANVIVGGTTTFTATAFDASNQPIAGTTFTWSTGDPNTATVNANGVATGVAAGDTTVTATAPNGVAGSAALHVTAVQPPPFPDTRFSEIHYDNVGVDSGEAIEIEGPAGTDIGGWSIVLYDGTNKTAYGTTTFPSPTIIPATCDPRGVVVVNYPSNGVQNGSPDGMALVDASNHVVEFLSYEGTFTAVGGPADGMLSTDIIAQEASSAPIGTSLQRDAFNHWSGSSTSTFGVCNPAGGGPPPGNSISFSGRVASDPALPIGFQAQIFATVRDANNQTVQAAITWSSDTPALASIDDFGVITALAPGTMILRATAADAFNTTATLSLPADIAVASTTAHYDGNTEFGEPADSDPSDDFIVRHAEFTASYNPIKNEPNWVSYDLDASAIGTEDRCNCFTFDPDLPASFLHYTTNDYTGSGAIAGFGIDRGHMTRSFDRTTGTLDNAHTFMFSNVVPQASDLNQGPWAQLENDLGDLATVSNKEVYIITGPAGNAGTLKNEGKIVIPTSTWKVAVIMPRDQGLPNIHDYRDIEVIAVNMPNVAGVRNVPWQTYQTTVDAIEALTGYDLLAALPDKVENIVEAGIKPPLAFLNGPYATNEGGTITLDGSASVDPNGTVVDYEWDFGDGTTGSGPTVSHTYAQDGVYTVKLVVTDNDGLTDENDTTATVANVAPVVGAFAGATLFPGENYAASGSFTDPGADPWTATVDYGDGAGPQPLALSGQSFALAHTYTTAGVFTVTVTVADDHTAASSTQTVTVFSAAQGIQQASDAIGALAAAGKLNKDIAKVLQVELALANAALSHGDKLGAQILLRGVVAELDLLVRLRALAAADEAPIKALLGRVIASISR